MISPIEGARALVTKGDKVGIAIDNVSELEDDDANLIVSGNVIIRGTVEIDTLTLPDDSITTDKIDSKAVTTGKIYSKAVTEDKIKDAAVTEDKIKDAAVTADKIDSNAVTTDKIADGTIEASKFETLVEGLYYYNGVDNFTRKTPAQRVFIKIVGRLR